MALPDADEKAVSDAAVAAEPTADSTDPTEPEAESPRPARGLPSAVRYAALILLVLVTIAAAAVAGRLWSEERAAAGRESSARDAIAAASEAATALTGLSYRRHEESLARLRDLATGEFRQQIDDQSGAFATTLTTHRVESRGRVLAAGIEERSEGGATVVVIAEASVNNNASEQEDRRQYRLRFGMTQHDGRWLVRGLEFVP
ncbi:hypothetical protein [Prauserella endophytica]|uniref:Mce-associated membrane protein n=1 Tax=Prauserella endophytica TaxID=1592324 RepID=A0ABY2S8U1_9PSEU|nr:hypothetical protein [Prauserella endophytica]TKG71714.1 hypothetical protein FCN18_09370 [Prauserella endophytica]